MVHRLAIVDFSIFLIVFPTSNWGASYFLMKIWIDQDIILAYTRLRSIDAHDYINAE